MYCIKLLLNLNLFTIKNKKVTRTEKETTSLLLIKSEQYRHRTLNGKLKKGKMFQEFFDDNKLHC